MEWLPDGRPLRVIGTQTDIHELIELHKGLEAGLHEKDVLIKEIHHRVKNNMQIIASMLSLEASQGRSRDYAALVEKTNRRIFAMAAVHEKLYAHDSTAFVPLQGYITELAQELVHLHRADVRIQVDCPDDQVSVDLDTAVPLGLIINELISNACEHAFPQDPAQKPHVLVTARSNTGELTVTVKDNGVGLSPENFSQQLAGQKSLGFVLVESLVHQLHGSLELETPADGGSRFILVIPV
ncbi:MAG: sensor histidine kinase, partial [Spirochaeta sp.]